ncbi:MAG: tRNA ((1)-)-methyltransferase [Bacteroidetes bacterium]|nr:tRNA ((1)-)-methyltransferase [Bacteroidota bacterium]MDP2885171.1 tRNA (guanosine(37)-N1)-methyltransferase TrmD [Ignavibacteria bacterium]
MRIDIVTGLPKLLESPLQESIIRRSQDKGKVQILVHDLREFTHDKHKTIDDTPYGGGAGMVLKPEPVFECAETLQAQRAYDEIILLTADGEKFDQQIANDLSLKDNLMFICGHYKGVDERVRDALVTRELSIGDFVLTGGELAAAVVVDAVVRLVPGVLNDSESALSDSFQDGLLGAPQYTRPPEYRGMRVPDVLLSGDHADIEEWRQRQRTERTQARRSDLLKKNL